MPKYNVRPYYGYDCSSESGFNNGNYLAAIQVDAESPEEAATKATEVYIKEHAPLPPKAEIDGSFGDWTIYWEFGHVWRTESGEEFQDETDVPDDVETECYYLYSFIDFSQDVGLVDESK